MNTATYQPSIKKLQEERQLGGEGVAIERRPTRQIVGSVATDMRINKGDYAIVNQNYIATAMSHEQIRPIDCG